MARLTVEVGPERSEDRGRGQYEKEQRDGLRDEDRRVAPGLDQRAPEVRLEGRTEDEAPVGQKSEGRNWLRIDLLAGGRYVSIPRTAVN
jgi:hypothetical protein